MGCPPPSRIQPLAILCVFQNHFSKINFVEIFREPEDEDRGASRPPSSRAPHADMVRECGGRVVDCSSCVTWSPAPPCPRLAQRPAQGAAWQGGALRKLLGIPPQRWTVPSLPPSAGTCGWSFYSWGYNPIPLNLVTKIVPVSATGSPHSRPESFSKFSSVARRRPLCPAGWPSPEWVSHYLSPHGVPAPPGSGFLLTVSGAAPRPHQTPCDISCP